MGKCGVGEINRNRSNTKTDLLKLQLLKEEETLWIKGEIAKALKPGIKSPKLV